MSPPVDPVRSDPALPERTDVLVIGGGIIGVSTALYLAEKGHAVTLCEKGRIGGEQSSRNWGWCRTMGRDVREIPLALESLRQWRGMNARIGAETGFRQAGIVYVAETEQELAAHAAWADTARAWQVDSRVLRGEALAALIPGAGRNFVGALHTPSDGRAEPAKAAPAIAEAARRQGATILIECAVRGVETKAGRIAGAVTERGRIACDAVVLAGGAWSRLFCGNLGVDFPQLKVLGSVLRTAPLEGAPETTVGGGDFAFRKRLDGGYTVARRGASVSDITPDSLRLFFDFLPTLRTEWKDLRLRIGRRFIEEWRIPRRWSLDAASPFEKMRVLDPAPTRSILDEARRNLARAFPAFAKMQVAEEWGGLMDVTPDAVPVISPVETVPGFYIASGFSGHGFGIGPGAGRLMADLVAGDAPVVDAAPFRLERLAKKRPATAPAGSR
ncbi:MAG: FAD-binding oxidoreductase [Alphaproteobacteria bacterium]|nr:FAD-binding oxidoreductase [Alphaproteobacteria bacterium]